MAQTARSDPRTSSVFGFACVQMVSIGGNRAFRVSVYDALVHSVLSTLLCCAHCIHMGFHAFLIWSNSTIRWL